MLKIRNYENHNETEIIHLFEKSFNQHMTLDYWNWNYNDNTYESKYIKLMWDDRNLAGHYAISPKNLKVYDRYLRTGLSMTTMTAPEYKNRGIFIKLARSLYEENYNNIPLVFGFPNNNSLHGFVKYLKWKHIADIVMYRCNISILDIKNIDRNIKFVSEFDSKFDELFNIVSRKYKIINCRNREYLDWRYRKHPRNRYQYIVFDRDDAYLGYCIYKLYSDGINNYCDLVDIIAVNTHVFTQLVQFVINNMVHKGINNINLWMNDNKLLEVSKEIGFKATNISTHFGSMINCDFLDEDILDFSNWYITMGDSDIF